jgi:hypothetical protein
LINWEKRENFSSTGLSDEDSDRLKALRERRDAVNSDIGTNSDTLRRNGKAGIQDVADANKLFGRNAAGFAKDEYGNQIGGFGGQRNGPPGPLEQKGNLQNLNANGNVKKDPCDCKEFIDAINGFNKAVANKDFIDACNNFPRTIKIEGMNNVTVELKGGEVLKMVNEQ